MSIIRRFGFVLSVVALSATSALSAPRPEIRAQALWASNTIQIVPELQPDIEAMLQRSPTFRAQYRRIAETGSVIVGVQVDARLCGTSFRARTTLRRYSSGLIVVAVSIGPGARPAEWIAHEFEHIIEQIDGRHLTHLARNHAHDVWFSGSDVIETDRAIRAGRTVRDELVPHSTR
jgi:hypothetical protein